MESQFAEAGARYLIGDVIEHAFFSNGNHFIITTAWLAAAYLTAQSKFLLNCTRNY